MKFELLVIGITAFLIYNTYHDGKYTKVLMSWKKYYQMAFFGIAGISIYLLMKRNPAQCRNMLLHANNVVKYMPLDRSQIDMINPILDFTSRPFMQNIDYNNTNSFFGGNNENRGGGFNRMMQSGKTGTKRSVSETKKKYVASQQNWKCGDCGVQLTHTFEVDHKIRLEHGGGNDVNNLVALCRNCHGNKTAMENM